MNDLSPVEKKLREFRLTPLNPAIVALTNQRLARIWRNGYYVLFGISVVALAIGLIGAYNAQRPAALFSAILIIGGLATILLGIGLFSGWSKLKWETHTAAIYTADVPAKVRPIIDQLVSNFFRLDVTIESSLLGEWLCLRDEDTQEQLYLAAWIGDQVNYLAGSKI